MTKNTCGKKLKLRTALGMPQLKHKTFVSKSSSYTVPNPRHQSSIFFLPVCPFSILFYKVVLILTNFIKVWNEEIKFILSEEQRWQ